MHIYITIGPWPSSTGIQIEGNETRQNVSALHLHNFYLSNEWCLFINFGTNKRRKEDIIEY
jgi:hypothetical protein